MERLAPISRVRSWMGFLITLFLITAGFVYKSFFPGAPYQAFSVAVVGAFGIFVTKKYARERLLSNGNNNVEAD